MGFCTCKESELFHLIPNALKNSNQVTEVEMLHEIARDDYKIFGLKKYLDQNQNILIKLYRNIA